MIYFIKSFAATAIGILMPSAFVSYDDAQQVPLAVAIPMALIGAALLIIFGIIGFSLITKYLL